MTSAIHSLIALVGAHPSWAYATVFLAALLEAVPVLGSFVPGSTIILGLGALIASGHLHLVPMLLSAVAGALIGDGAAFWTGHRAQRSILTAWPLSAYPHVVERSEQFFQRHGTLAVFFARFVAPVRAFVPVTAGALGMPPQRFFPVNAAAIMLWAPAHILPGLVAASAMHRWGSTLVEGHTAVMLAALVVALGVIAWAVWQHCHRPVPAPDPG